MEPRLLLRLAREAIAAALAREATGARAPDPAWLLAAGASFVTLKLHGCLRGCVGSVFAVRPLGEDVRLNAVAAAMRDPRFAPLGAHELTATRIEVSVLSGHEALRCANEAEAVREVRPGMDGLLLESGGRRGVFLPQVWEEIPDPAEFLRHLRRKAGLPAAGWGPGTRLLRFGVLKVSE
jgi:AmmeMemoRadiSam system protein A